MVVSQYQQRSINLQELFQGHNIIVQAFGYTVKGKLIYCQESRIPGYLPNMLILEGLNGRKTIVHVWNIIKKEVTD